METNAVLLLVAAPAGAVDDATVDRLHRRFGRSAEIVRCGSDEDLARAVAGAGARRLAVAGGDGSLHRLVQLLWDEGRMAEPVGLVPLGTGNDFARSAGVPLEIEAAVDAILAGRSRRMDLLLDDSRRVVVNAAHLGIGAAAARIGGGLKGMLGRSAYRIGGVVAGVVQHGWRLRVDVDGVRFHDGTVLQVAIGNGSMIGGGAPLIPEARPDDGLLDVLVSADVGPLARLGYARALRTGAHVTRRRVRMVRAKSVTVSGRAPLNVDGELAELTDARTWTVAANAWSIYVP